MSNILKTNTPPANLPVSLEDVKMHLRVTDTAEDAHITALIGAARDWAETFTRRTFINTTYQMQLDCFPSNEFYLPRSPLVTLDSIKYTDEDNVEQTIATTVYKVDEADAIPVRVSLKADQEWPTDIIDELSPIKVTFTTGYSEDEYSNETPGVPAAAVAAIKMLVGHWYENREEVVVGVTANIVPAGVERLLWSIRIYEDQ